MTAEIQLTSTYVLEVDSLVLLTIAAKKRRASAFCHTGLVTRTIDNLC